MVTENVLIDVEYWVIENLSKIDLNMHIVNNKRSYRNAKVTMIFYYPLILAIQLF